MMANETTPAGHAITPIVLYRIYPRKKPELGRMGIVNDITAHEKSNGWTVEHSVMVRQSDAQAVIDQLKADLQALQNFTADVFGDFPEQGDMDGIDLQNAAESCGLLKKETVTAPCGENCACAQCGVDGPTECYRVQPVFMRARMAVADLDALSATVGETRKGNRT